MILCLDQQYMCQNLNGTYITSEASNPLGWKCGQFTLVSVQYFLAIFVQSLYNKRKEICIVMVLHSLRKAHKN